MPVVIVTRDRQLVDDDGYGKNEPRENHIRLQRKQVAVEIEVVSRKMAVAFEDANDHQPKHRRHEEKAGNENPEDPLQFFRGFR